MPRTKSHRRFVVWALLPCLDIGCFGEPPDYPSLSGTAGSETLQPSLDCPGPIVTAVDASVVVEPVATELQEGVTYAYSAEEIPLGLSIDPQTGQVSGIVTGSPGEYSFDVTLEGPEFIGVSATCSLTVRPRISAALALLTVPYCVEEGGSLLDLLTNGAGDGTPITCDAPQGYGDGRVPNGISINPTTCSTQGSIDEDRMGTWVFMVRGTQSGAEFYVPYCVTNDAPQGYDIEGRHSGIDDALIPFMHTYDPTASFDIGGDGTLRFEVTSPGLCGHSCFYRYSFLYTDGPLEGFDLTPDGLVSKDMGDPMDEPIGFFHELQANGPPVPAEFVDRPWAVSTNISYCISADQNGCDDVGAASQGALEFGLIMVPIR